MRVGYIYRFRNIVNDKCYYGSTMDIKTRYECHINKLKSNKHHSLHLQWAYNLYGYNNFRFEIVEENIPVNELLSKEQWWINHSRCYLAQYGYNIARYAGRPTYGIKLSEETKRKIREKTLGKKASLETRMKMSVSRKARVNNLLSEETKKRISESLKGKTSWNKGLTHTEETRKKISEKALGRHHTEETKKKIGLASKGIKRFPMSDATKYKLSVACKGKISKRIGMKHTEGSKRKISESHMGKLNVMFGKHHSDEIKRKISVSNIGKNTGKAAWNKGLHVGNA